MKKIWLVLVMLSGIHMVCGQDGMLLSRETHQLSDSTLQLVQMHDPLLFKELSKIDFYRITYLSDGLRVIAYAAEPAKPGKYPCIISNRGGNRDFGAWDDLGIAAYLGRMASWGYVVLATQYRGTDGGEGMEEFGGRDVYDVLYLLEVLNHFDKADTSRIGIEGVSRGGMMTYLALKESCAFKAAVVTAGTANAFTNVAARPEMELFVYGQLVPDYWNRREEALRERSVVYWADQLCKTTPILIMHGSSDWRVPADGSLELINILYEEKHPVRFILFEGADHGLSPYRQQAWKQRKDFFDHYVRDLQPLPNMDPHGP